MVWPPVVHQDLADAVQDMLDHGAGDAVFTVAASNTPTAQRSRADYLCDGTADQVEIQAAIDAAAANSPGGGDVVLLPGTYNVTGTVSVGHPSDGTGTYRIHLRFERGARLRWLGLATQKQAILKIESSDVLVSNPWVEGSGAKGNGVGICFGGDVATFGGRYTRTVYRSAVHNPHVTNCYAGICFAVNHAGSNSSGDNIVVGGYVNSCVDGIRSEGFTNRVYGTTVAGCDYNLHGTADRNSHMVEVFGATLNQWAQAAVWLEKDKGSTFVNLWAEHTDTQSAVPTQAILLGNTTDSSTTAHNTAFLGTTSLTLLDESYAVRHIRSNNVRFDNLNLSTNGALPTTAVIRQDTTHTGLDVYQRVCWMTGAVPAGWTWALLRSKAVGVTGKCVVRAVPAKAGSATNLTHGDATPTPERGFRVDVAGSPNAATYWAKEPDGNIAAWGADTATTSGLRAVLAAIDGPNRHIQFGPGRFHFLDAPLGTEPWAAVEDHYTWGTAAEPSSSGLTIEGAGMTVTILSNRTNFGAGGSGADTEPLSFTNAQRVTIRDLSVESCGANKNSTDAIDFDQGAGCLVERVRITRSRGRAIVVDGGDVGRHGDGTTLRQVSVFGRPPRPMVIGQSGGTLATGTTYRYAVSWVDADLAGVGVAGETKVSEVASVSGSTAYRVQLPIGAYSTTARKVYRAPAGSSAWVLLSTVNDNTTLTFTDTGAAGSSVTMPVSTLSTIQGTAGLEILGTDSNTIESCWVEGVSGYGINVVRKGSGSTLATADRNRVLNNTVRGSGQSGLRIFGGSQNLLGDNTVINSGTATTKAASVRVDGAAGQESTNNLIRSNVLIDDQDATSPSGGVTTNFSCQTTASTATNRFLDNISLGSGASSVTAGTGNTERTV